jgi:hypothetical protein
MKSSIFGTKYPIVCAAMLAVNDLKLALAVSNAGCFPTFHLDPDKWQDIRDFASITGSNKFGLFYVFNENPRLHSKILEFIKEMNPLMVELVLLDKPMSQESIDFFEFARKNNIIIIQKIAFPNKNCMFIPNIKGSEAAGAPGIRTTKENFLIQKKLSINEVCCSGGISTGNDIDWFLDHGVTAIYMGTPFALTEESAISYEVKLKLLMKKSSDLEKITAKNRNAIIFDREQYSNNDENASISFHHENASISLKNGVENKGGHVYMGHALDNIDEIVNVKQLIDNIVKNSSQLRRM